MSVLVSKTGERWRELGRVAAALALAVAVAVHPSAAQEPDVTFDCADIGTLHLDATKEELRDAKKHHRSARLYFSQGLFPKAARSSELAVHLDALKAEYHMQLAMAYAELGCYEHAGAAFATASQLVEGDPKQAKLAEQIQNNRKFYWTGRFNAGIEALDGGESERAGEEFRHAIAIDSTDVRAWRNLGTVLAELERNDEALAAYEAALELDPADESSRQRYRLTKSNIARGTLTDAFGHLNSRDEAEQARGLEVVRGALGMFDEVLAQEPPDKELLEYRDTMGKLYQTLGQFETEPAAVEGAYARAVENYRLAAEARHRRAEPDGEGASGIDKDPQYLEQVLGCFVGAADWDSTMAYGQKLVDLDPKNHNAYKFIGEALRNTGKRQEALTYFLVMQCLDPETSKAVDDVNDHYISLLQRYAPADDIVNASIENLDTPGEIRLSEQADTVSEAWFFWEEGYVDCFYDGRHAGKVSFETGVGL